MALWPKRDVARAEELIDLLLGCGDRAPFAEIEQLIRLAQKAPVVKKRVLEVLDSWVCDGGGDLAACWFGAVAGELGREGLGLCVDGLGRAEEDVVDECCCLSWSTTSWTCSTWSSAGCTRQIIRRCGG